MRISYVILLSTLLLNCNQGGKIVTDENGKIIFKEYRRKSGELDSVIEFKENILVKNYFNYESQDSTYSKIYHRKNGTLQAEGLLVDGKDLGKWKLYDSKSRLRKIVEFVDLCGKEYPNQEWNYDDKGKLLNERSNYFNVEFSSPRLTTKNDNYILVSYIPFIKNANCFMYFSPEFDSQFCNISEIKANVIYSKDRTFKINLNVDIKGDFKFRGYILEDYKSDKTSKVSEKWTYIDIPFKIQ